MLLPLSLHYLIPFAWQSHLFQFLFIFNTSHALLDSLFLSLCYLILFALQSHLFQFLLCIQHFSLFSSLFTFLSYSRCNVICFNSYTSFSISSSFQDLLLLFIPLYLLSQPIRVAIYSVSFPPFALQSHLFQFLYFFQRLLLLSSCSFNLSSYLFTSSSNIGEIFSISL